MFEQYYEEELRYLYESGCEFARAHPERAQYLNIDSVGDRDPYVERLFEGFAFLTARIRQRLEDSFPQLTEGLVNLLWPQYLQEIPSLSIVQLTPRTGLLNGSRILPARSEIISDPAGNDGVRCKFTTVHPVAVHPLVLGSVERNINNQNNEILTFTFLFNKTVDWSNFDLKSIRLFLHAELPVALKVHRALTAMVKDAEIEFGDSGQVYRIDPVKAVTPGGFTAEESVLPQTRAGFTGYSLLREYFVYPEKFLFIDLNGIDTLPSPQTTPEKLTYRITIREPLPLDKSITPSMFKLNCCPAANLFRKTLEPITKTGMKSEYRVVADSSYSSSVHAHSIIKVIGTDNITGNRSVYEPLYTFANIGSDIPKTYATRFCRSSDGKREMDMLLSGSEIVDGQIREENLVIEAWCTNGKVPREYLSEKQISSPGPGFPDSFSVTNITRPTPPCLPPAAEDLLWKFQAHMAANQTSLASKDALKQFLQLYNWSPLEGRARKIEAITEVKSGPVDALYSGSVLRGVKFTVTIEEPPFDDTGDLHLFGLVLSQFLSQYVAINSFCELEFILKPSDKRMSWNNVEGKQCLI